MQGVQYNSRAYTYLMFYVQPLPPLPPSPQCLPHFGNGMDREEKNLNHRKLTDGANPEVCKKLWNFIHTAKKSCQTEEKEH